MGWGFRISLSMILVQGMVCASESPEKHSAKDVIVSGAKPKSKEQANVASVQEMFTNANIIGKIESIYSYHDEKQGNSPYSTDVGGQLKYELANYNGFGGGVEFTTSHIVNDLSGDGNRKNTFISSTDSSYTELSQAYIEYGYKTLNFRVGRQLIDTPLADSDDFRIIDNTFEAATARYSISDFSFMAGYLDRWQGTDAGLDPDHPWQDTGKDGTYFGSLSYDGTLFSGSAWYYDVSEAETSNTATGNVANKTFYADASINLLLNETYELHLNGEYLNQSEQDQSGIEANIYGLMMEFIVDKSLTIAAAYNHSDEKSTKGSFAGFGGGTLFTGMDNMVLDVITFDREASAVVGGLTFEYDDFTFLYAYGEFKGDENSIGEEEHIIEQNAGFEYVFSQDLAFSALVVISEDKEDTDSPAYYSDGDFVNYRMSLAYRF